ncbi:MAG: hypothetical protein JWR50_2760 [Mucilaginibacter sp.]|nr:hypothetical protein [Mucilaginibacter sp.]
MKKLFVLLIILIISRDFASAQKEANDFKYMTLKNTALSVKELKEMFASMDFSKLFTKTNNSYTYGFIGDNYQRIRIKFISIKKDSVSPNTYNIYGKSMVKNNIEEFRGTIKITNIRKYKGTSMGLDNEWKNKGLKGQFVILGDYDFFEDSTKAHSGIFKGTFESDFYLDKTNKYHYDDIEMYADGYVNNEFVGKWVQYKTIVTKRCNWGDYRIPNSGDLDIGAGEFSPADKYLKYGWQTLRDVSFQKTESKKAIAAEKAKWWNN